MNQQALVFDAPRARARDPQTSHAAASRAKALQTAHCCLVLGALRQGAAGKDEIGRRAGLTGVAVCRRLAELEKARAVKPTGRTVESDSGRQEREWCLA